MNNAVFGQQLESINALMKESIDYAGIFPPGDLPLGKAIKKYRAYLDNNDSWMLRSFVLPIDKLGELEKYMELFSVNKKLSLSFIISKSESSSGFKKACQSDSVKLQHFMDKFSDIATVASFEVPLPPVDITKNILKDVSNIASQFQVNAFCEMTKSLSKDWLKHMKDVMNNINKFNLDNEGPKLGYKLRSGGIKKHLFPTIEQIAHTLTESNSRNIPIKFTAGLHHPIRMYRDEVDTKMHGFLNVFMGYILQSSYKLDIGDLEEILRDENDNNFTFTKNGFKWKDYKVSLNSIEIIRTSQLSSFGSCSFDEPREDLKELKIMK